MRRKGMGLVQKGLVASPLALERLVQLWVSLHTGDWIVEEACRLGEGLARDQLHSYFFGLAYIVFVFCTIASSGLLQGLFPYI